MKINLSELFEQQKKFDEFIHKKHRLTYEKIFMETKLALFVELSELANEIKSFKFWSVKGSSPKEKILEEYVDGLNFITSLCLMKKIKPIFITNIKNEKTFTKHEITIKFLDLFKKIYKLNSKNSLIKWFIKYLNFGFCLNFSLNEILNAHMKKNKINYRRQKNNY